MVLGTGTDTLIGSLVATGVGVALWILRGIRTDVRTITKTQQAHAEALNAMRVSLAGDYVPQARYESGIKGLHERIESARQESDNQFERIGAQITEIKVTLARRRGG